MTALVQVLVAAFAGLTVLGFADALHWTLAFAGAPRIQYAAALLVLSVIAVWLRHWATLGIAALAVLVNVAVVTPLWVGSAAQAQSVDATLDVALFNTKIRSDARAVAEWLAREQPDVAVLTATTDSWVEAMRHDSGMEVAVSRSKGQDLELLVLTGSEPRRTAVLEWGRTSRERAVEVVTELEGQPVRVLGLHPVSPVGSDRAARRDRMLAHAGAWAASDDRPSVVVGDLNAVPWSTPLTQLRAVGGLADSLNGQGVQPSWPAPIAWAGVPLDHVLHSREFTTVERELGPSFGSNHRLVRARLALTD